MKSLEEVSKIVGLSRRAIQEYEKSGVISKPAHRTKRGYLRYDDQDIARLFQVRFYRELGYDAQEIREIFEAPDFNRHNAITCQIREMRKKKERLEDLITLAETIRDQELPPDALTCAVPGIHNVPFDVALCAFSGGLRTLQDSEDEDSDLDDEEIEKWFMIMEKVLELVQCGYHPRSQAVQNRIGMLYDSMARSIFPSIYVFWGIWQLFAPGTELGELLDDLYGADSAKILYEAVRIYSGPQMKAMATPGLLKVINQIESLHKKQFSADSQPVQAEIDLLLHTLQQKTGMDPTQCLQLNSIWKREAFRTWELPQNDREQLEFLARAMDAYDRKKENAK